MKDHQKVGMRYRNHTAPCGLPCKTAQEAEPGEITHPVAEDCPQCKITVQREKRQWPTGPTPVMPIKWTAPPPVPPSPKVPWNQIVIPPHALKMAKIRAGFDSVVDAAIMIEMFYPLTEYNSSQKEAKGTSHTKRTKPGKKQRLSQRVDLYTMTHDGVEWVFYMKRNVLMTVHRNDEWDYGGPPPDKAVRLDNADASSKSAREWTSTSTTTHG
jgi:hypothetical protein